MARHFNALRPSSRLGQRETLALLPLLLVFASSLLSVPEAAADDRDRRWNFRGWTPSIAATLGVHAVDLAGFVRATDSSGADIRLPDAASDAIVTPMLRLSLELESPELPAIPGHVRLFGSVDYFATFPPDRNAAGEGDPSGFFIKPGFSNPPEQAIEGTGSQTTVETNRSAYGFTGGASFPVEIGGFRFFLKPGVSWMRYQWDIRGVVLHAIKPPFLIGRDFRAVELRARGKLYSNGVGPYLAIEMEPDDWGPVLVGIFVEGAYYRTLGDKSADITDSVTISGDGIPADTYLARWGIEVGDDFWRAAAGLRVYLATD